MSERKRFMWDIDLGDFALDAAPLNLASRDEHWLHLMFDGISNEERDGVVELLKRRSLASQIRHRDDPHPKAHLYFVASVLAGALRAKSRFDAMAADAKIIGDHPIAKRIRALARWRRKDQSADAERRLLSTKRARAVLRSRLRRLDREFLLGATKPEKTYLRLCTSLLAWSFRFTWGESKPRLIATVMLAAGLLESSQTCRPWDVSCGDNERCRKYPPGCAGRATMSGARAMYPKPFKCLRAEQYVKTRLLRPRRRGANLKTRES